MDVCCEISRKSDRDVSWGRDLCQVEFTFKDNWLDVTLLCCINPVVAGDLYDNFYKSFVLDSLTITEETFLLRY